MAEGTFDHEKLIAFRLSLELVDAVHGVARRFPPAYSYLGDQLRRASTSVVLNTAEGAGEFAVREKRRFYRMARRSATECAAVIAVGHRLRIVSAEDAREARCTLTRVVRLLTGLSRERRHPGS
jgi:four helix bundle protein